jgi:hypothetical protein
MESPKVASHHGIFRERNRFEKEVPGLECLENFEKSFQSSYSEGGSPTGCYVAAHNVATSKGTSTPTVPDLTDEVAQGALVKKTKSILRRLSRKTSKKPQDGDESVNSVASIRRSSKSLIKRLSRSRSSKKSTDDSVSEVSGMSEFPARKSLAKRLTSRLLKSKTQDSTGTSESVDHFWLAGTESKSETASEGLARTQEEVEKATIEPPVIQDAIEEEISKPADISADEVNENTTSPEEVAQEKADESEIIRVTEASIDEKGLSIEDDDQEVTARSIPEETVSIPPEDARANFVALLMVVAFAALSMASPIFRG